MKSRHIYYIVIGVVLALAIVFVVARSVGHKRVSTDVEAPMPTADSVAIDTLSIEEGGLSPFDRLFRKAARRHKVDWRLLAAMAYAESHFRTDAVSSRGAVGLMQVMPHIAEAFDVPRENLTDAETNIDVGTRIYRSMQRMLQLPKDIDDYDRMAFTVASYNCGASRVIDARNLAEYYDDNLNDWETVSDYLLLLAEEEFYNHEAVTGGRFGAPKTTIAYVRQVMERYDRYCRRIAK